MTEETLRELSFDELIDLMMKKIHELVYLEREDIYPEAIYEKKKELELIHRIIKVRHN